jgi:hypothetical protein
MARCGICGREGAENVCRICGQLVCRDCYLPEEGLCLKCSRREHLLGNPFGGSIGLLTAGTVLIFFGFILMFIASVLSIRSGEWIIIFFPFILTNSGGWAIALMLVFLFFLFLPWLMTRRRLRQP